MCAFLNRILFSLNDWIAKILQQGLSKDEVDQMLDGFLAECAKKEGGNDADIKFIKDRNLPVTKEQDCMVACIGENFELASSIRFKI